MKKQSPYILKIKIALSALIFIFSVTFSTSTAYSVYEEYNQSSGFCYSCGSFTECYDGSTILDCGFEFCEIVPGWPPCRVYGSYGECSGASVCQSDD